MEQHFGIPGRHRTGFGRDLPGDIPGFPRAATDARSWEARVDEAIDCLEEAVAGRMKRGDDIPTRSPAARARCCSLCPRSIR